MYQRTSVSDLEIEVKGNDDASVIVFLLSSNPLEHVYDEIIEEHSLLLVNIIIDDWFSLLSPYPHERVFHGGADFKGGGPVFLKRLTDEILVKVESLMKRKPEKRILLGYSLAGLFSIYASTMSNLFSSVGSISGSLWYPNFIDYLKEHESYARNIYLSLGDQESKENNRFLSKGLTCQFEALDIFNRQSKNVLFELNHGGHFIDEESRMLKGLDWLLEQD